MRKEASLKRTCVIAFGLVLGVLTTIGLMAVTARTAPASRPYGRPIGPEIVPDTGAGELLLAVVGGVYDTRAQAEEAGAAKPFGDLQGFYVVPVAQFQGFQQQVGEPGDFALVSVFRTDEGATDFMELAAEFGYSATILPERVRSLGGLYAGLGQEENPDGSGPLAAPVAESLP
jgi:hypothetical protein